MTMELEEFLATANVDDEIALAAAHSHSVTKLVKIDTTTRKTAVETVDIFNGTVDRLTNFTPDSALTPEQQAIAASIAPKIVKAFIKLMNTQFYINLNDAAVSEAFAAALSLGVLTQVEHDGIYKAAELITSPFANTTLEQVKAIRYPATWLPCEHNGQAYLISVSNQDSITMSVDLAVLVSNVSVRCYWSTAVGQQEFLSNRNLNISGTDSLYVSQSFTRASLGLPTTAKVLRFEYTSAYDGVVNSVSVSK
jgi:hypothetical protein